jgi:hypothetical protein
MSPLTRPLAMLLILISLSAHVQAGGPQFVYPTLNWGICENATAVDLRLLLETAYNGSGANLTYSIVTSPLHGFVALSGTAVMPPGGGFGAFQPSTATYTPDAGYTDTDVIVFQITDGTLSSQMTLTLNMVPPPPQPGAIIGQDVDTVGPNPVRYTIDGPIDSNATYTWSYTGSNIFISGSPFAGYGNPVDVSFYPYPTATSGVLSIVASTTCGTSAASTKAITVQPIQFISFDSIPPHTYGDIDFYIDASATSELPVRFVIADQAVADFTTDWTGRLQIHIIKAGHTTITAFQDGEGGLQPATPVVRTLLVNKKDQFITSLDLPLTFILGIDTPPTLNSTATSGLPVQYTSSDIRVATIVGDQVNFLDSGTVTITVTQPGDSDYNAAPPISATVEVFKPLRLSNGSSIFPNPSHGSFYCLPDPSFTATGYMLYNARGQRVTGVAGNIYYSGYFVVTADNVGLGIYFLKVFGKKAGKDATQQFTVLIN